MDKSIRSRRAGPRTFNREDALETAMRLFWRHGYEGVSISDLTGAMGIAAPSLYAAFGSKAALYREALDRYAALPGAPDDLEEAENLDDAITKLFRAAVDVISDPLRERGCMVSTGLIQCAAEHEDLARGLTARRGTIRDGIAKVFSRWLDVSSADSLARYCAAVLQGISVQAHDGASKAQLVCVSNEAIAGIRARRL